MLLLDTLRVDDEVIMDKIIEKLPKDNDRYYIEHLIESKKRKWKIKNCLKKQKKCI